MAFWDNMKKAVKEGLESTKEVLEKAKDKTKELGEKGVTKFEIMQLEKQAEKRFCRIGTHVYDILVKKGQNTISKGTPDIKKLIDEIQEIEKEIDKKEEELSD
ncbi:MAG TPA: hypothetical protein VMZ05_11805 [Spirochaetota bacterium]|nr:hypothetical protein [Spirochaetota bacterium]